MDEGFAEILGEVRAAGRGLERRKDAAGFDGIGRTVPHQAHEGGRDPAGPREEMGVGGTGADEPGEEIRSGGVEGRDADDVGAAVVGIEFSARAAVGDDTQLGRASALEDLDGIEAVGTEAKGSDRRCRELEVVRGRFNERIHRQVRRARDVHEEGGEGAVRECSRGIFHVGGLGEDRCLDAAQTAAEIKKQHLTRSGTPAHGSCVLGRRVGARKHTVPARQTVRQDQIRERLEGAGQVPGQRHPIGIRHPVADAGAEEIEPDVGTGTADIEGHDELGFHAHRIDRERLRIRRGDAGVEDRKPVGHRTGEHEVRTVRGSWERHDGRRLPRQQRAGAEPGDVGDSGRTGRFPDGLVAGEESGPVLASDLVDNDQVEDRIPVEIGRRGELGGGLDHRLRRERGGDRCRNRGEEEELAQEMLHGVEGHGVAVTVLVGRTSIISPKSSNRTRKYWYVAPEMIGWVSRRKSP